MALDKSKPAIEHSTAERVEWLLSDLGRYRTTLFTAAELSLYLRGTLAIPMNEETAQGFLDDLIALCTDMQIRHSRSIRSMDDLTSFLCSRSRH